MSSCVAGWLLFSKFFSEIWYYNDYIGHFWREYGISHTLYTILLDQSLTKVMFSMIYKLLHQLCWMGNNLLLFLMMTDDLMNQPYLDMSSDTKIINKLLFVLQYIDKELKNPNRTDRVANNWVLTLTNLSHYSQCWGHSQSPFVQSTEQCIHGSVSAVRGV